MALTQSYSLSKLVNPAIRGCFIETHEERRATLRRAYDYISQNHPDETAMTRHITSVEESEIG